MRTLLCGLTVAIAVSVSAEMPPSFQPDPLDTKITLPSGKDTFQRRLDFIAKQTGVRISVDGAGLQRLGITRNQNTFISIEMTNASAIDHIVALCRQIENTAGAVEVRRADDGSVIIAAKRSP